MLSDFTQHTLQSFSENWRTYYFLFDAWRSKDTKKMIQDLVSHYVDLEKLWRNVRANDAGDSHWKPEIAGFQRGIKDKIIKFGGNEGILTF